MKKSLPLWLCACVLGTGVAHAAPKKALADEVADGTNGRGYGAAGCGLGSIIFGAKPGFVQVFAATTNGTFSSQTFGITSGTSNCSDTGSSQAATRTFIQVNREALAKDASRGAGDTIRSLAAVAGCRDAEAVGLKLQQNFNTVFPTATTPTSEVTDAVISTLGGDSALACNALSS